MEPIKKETQAQMTKEAKAANELRWKLPMAPDVAQLKVDILKVAAGGRHFLAAPLCQPVGVAGTTETTGADVTMTDDDATDTRRIQEEIDDAIESYMNSMASTNDTNASLGDVGLSHQFEEDMEMQWEKETALNWEQEQQVCEIADDRKVDAVVAPVVVTRGTPPVDYTCFGCGVRSAHDLQLPSEVFNVAYTVEGEEGALRNLHEMAQSLVEGEYDKVIARTSVCRRLRCMISQNKLTCGDYEAWRYSGKIDEDGNRGAPRKQLMLGTDRMNQSILLIDNLLLLRWLYVIRDEDGEATFTKEQITALFHWFVLNSQFVQEREKRFIATAMAIVESATFPFKFQPAQSFVNQMASIPRNYVETQLLAHIFDDTLEPARWVPWGMRLMETGCPKAADAAYMLMCIFHWRADGEPRDATNKPILRIRHSAKYKELFTVDGFGKALAAATQKHSKDGGQRLYYASAPTGKSSVTMSTSQTREETRQLLKLLTGGSTRRGYTVGHGVQGVKCKPTCGSTQADSSVHTEQRYEGVATALHLNDKEKADMLHLVIKVLPMGNSEGKEKLSGETADRTKAKACAVLRKPTEYTPKRTVPVTSTRMNKIREALGTRWEIRPKNR